MAKGIPFYVPEINTKIAIKKIKMALKNHWLTTGPLVQEFEKSLACFLGVSKILTLSSGTAALQIALRVLGIGKGDKVLLPANTFIATLETVYWVGANPVLCDISVEDWNISLEEIEKKGKKAKAVIAVPFAGAPLPMEDLVYLCQKYKLKLILDSAHALEAKYKGKFLHTYADATCFSFYATKNLTTAEGGALYLAEENLLEKARSLSLHGMSKEAWRRYHGGSWQYDIVEFGYKANMSDVHAALGLSQISNLVQNHEKRKNLALYYQSLFQYQKDIRLQKVVEHGESAWHLFVISFHKKLQHLRDRLSAYLYEQKIGHSVHFIPLYRFQAVQKQFGFLPKDFPNTEDYYRGALSLPFYPGLKKSQVKRVVRAIETFLQTP